MVNVRRARRPIAPLRLREVKVKKKENSKCKKTIAHEGLDCSLNGVVASSLEKFASGIAAVAAMSESAAGSAHDVVNAVAELIRQTGNEPDTESLDRVRQYMEEEIQVPVPRSIWEGVFPSETQGLAAQAQQGIQQVGRAVANQLANSVPPLTVTGRFPSRDPIPHNIPRRRPNAAIQSAYNGGIIEDNSWMRPPRRVLDDTVLYSIPSLREERSWPNVQTVHDILSVHVHRMIMQEFNRSLESVSVFQHNEVTCRISYHFFRRDNILVYCRLWSLSTLMREITECSNYSQFMSYLFTLAQNVRTRSLSRELQGNVSVDL